MLRKYTEKNFAETYFKFQISLPRLARGLIHWNLLRNNHRQHGLDRSIAKKIRSRECLH